MYELISCSIQNIERFNNLVSDYLENGYSLVGNPFIYDDSVFQAVALTNN